MSNESIQGQQQQQAYSNDDEITLKELIMKIQEFWRELWKQKIWIAIAGFLVAGLFLYKALRTSDTYEAKMTFMVNEDKGGGGGGISSLLGQFGFGGGKRGGYNLDKILKLATSRNIVQDVLFVKTEIDGKEDFLANHVIRIYEMHKEWQEDSLIADFLFERGDILAFNLNENKALKSVHSKVVGNERIEGFMKKGYDKDTGILSIRAKTLSEELSIQVIDTLYARLSDYYISRSIEPQQNTYNTIKLKADSLRRLLRNLNAQSADFQDRYTDILDKRDAVRPQNLRFEKTATAQAYGEVLKNLELADFTLKNETPAFQIIDAPIAPITPKVKSRVKAIAMGGILGGFLAVLFFIVRKIIRDAMNE